MRSALFDGIRLRWPRAGAVLVAAAALWLTLGGAPALAAGESHPQLGPPFGSFSNPNGIAVDESTGNVYVADIETATVYKFGATGTPVNFSALGSNALTGSDTPAKSFSFPNVYGTPAAIAVDNACVQHRPALTGAACSEYDPSAGDLYVMDAGNGVIDKFNVKGEYVHQITGFAPAPASEHELLGLGVDANGAVHAELSNGDKPLNVLIEEFDGSAANNPVATQTNFEGQEPQAGLPPVSQAHGFAVSPTGDNYPVYEPSCACTTKLGQRLSPLGRVDGGNAGDVSVAVDPATGHVYIDDQSSVAEWDTGAMNRDSLIAPGPSETVEAAGVLVATFTAPLLSATSSAQGGIAVNGSTGEIYLSNPSGKDVYIFGSDAPRVTVGAASGVTEQTAMLTGTVNPRRVLLAKCEFEYQLADDFGRVTEHNGEYEDKTLCKQTPAEIGSGTAPVAVSANLTGLTPGELYRFRLVATNASGSSQSGGFLPTVGEGFGIKSFLQSFLNQDGTPDTQAGSHPFETVNNFTMKSHFVRMESNADSPYVRVPNGALKDVVVDLPPGLVGDPNATPKKCTQQELIKETFEGERCPRESLIGNLAVAWSNATPFLSQWQEKVYNMVAPRGVAVQLGSNFVQPLLYINNGLFAGGDYPIRATVLGAPPSAPVVTSNLTVSGVVGEGEARKAFLTLPTGCHGPLRSTMHADSWQEPGHWVEKPYESSNAAGTPVSLTGCAKLKFPAEISVAPDTTDASASSGLTVHVKVPQAAALNVDGLAESSLRDTTVTLPEGMAINPAGADGLQACTSDPGALPVQGTLPGQETVFGTPGDEIGFKGFADVNKNEPSVPWATFSSEKPNPLQPGANFCPNGSKIATVKIKVPVLEHELEGSMYLASQNANPFGSLIAMYLVAEDPFSGTLIKLAGEVKLTDTGQIVSTFNNAPDGPFEDLEIHFFGGERAPLTTPSRCGTYTTKAVFTPWDGNAPSEPTSSFTIDHGPGGGPCPGASLPFNPSFTGGSTNLQAGSFTPLTGTFSRQDGEQQIARLHFRLPPGLSGVLKGVKLCDEADANAGTCGAESLIGETTVAAGVGSDPITVSGGRVYLTGPYHGAPFGISVVNPVKAGPFDLERDTSNPAQNPPCDCVVVRGKLEIDPLTAAVTITSNSEAEGHAIPHLIDGIPVEIKKVNFTTTRSGFQFNPTNCEKMAIAGSVESDEGVSRHVEVPFQVTNCASLKFKPSFKASTQAKTSRRDGASLHVHLTYPSGSFGHAANIHEVKVELPKALPSRLKTLQHACTATQFRANPAGCPPLSVVGRAKAITPILPVPLQGPAYFVSNGGQRFPELIIVLQGYGVTIDLHGETFISKNGITSSTFKTVPDQPVESFELTLPEGEDSALAANRNLCAGKLLMPTLFVGQNGASFKRKTPISVSGCKPEIHVLGHHVKGARATIRVQVPSAGTLTATGHGIARAVKRARKAGVITIRVSLSRHDRRAAARRHLKIRVKAGLRFKPKHGAPLTAHVKLLLG